MSEDIRWETKALGDNGGLCRPDVLAFYQDTTRQRGYPPFPIEIALKFELETQQAVGELDQVLRHLALLTINSERPRQHVPQVSQSRLPAKELLPGPATIDLRPYRGRNGWPNQRDRRIYWLAAARNTYLRGSVDFMIHDEQIALTPETEAYFYSADAVFLPDYLKGSRPLLEQVARETTQGCTTDRAKALALVNLIGNPDSNPYRDLQYHDMTGPNYMKRPLGGTEEQVLRKSWHMCNEITRLLVFFCQIAGLPARTVFLFIDPLTGLGGHAVTEVFFEGKWNLVENNWGIMFLMDSGYFASTVELRDDPSIVNDRADVGGGLCLSHAFFTGPISIVPYSIDHVKQFSYPTQKFRSL